MNVSEVSAPVASSPSVVMRFPCTLEDVASKRSNYLAGLDARMEWERANVADTDEARKNLASILDFLSSTKVRGAKRDGSNADAFSLGYAVAHGIDYTVELVSKRVDGALRNVYSITKDLAFQRVLNGAKFRDDADDNTNAATILMLAAEMNGGKRAWDFINATMVTFGSAATYSSGATQGGSSLRALASLGIVEKVGNAHNVINKDSFKLLVTAAKARLRSATK